MLRVPSTHPFSISLRTLRFGLSKTAVSCVLLQALGPILRNTYRITKKVLKTSV